MQEYENNIYAKSYLLPKIIMSYHNCNNSTSNNNNNTKDMLKRGCKQTTDENPVDDDILINKTECTNLSSPEIRCSPSPCIFDKLDTNEINYCDKRLIPSRSPSPDVYGTPKRRSASPFRRSTSPIYRNNNNGSRRGSNSIPTGYEIYQKSLLEVPMLLDYGDASSDDLSSEWDSDVPEVTHSIKVR